MAGGQAGCAGEVPEQGGEQGQVEQRGGEADHQPDRVAQQLRQVPAEEQAGVGDGLHAAAPAVATGRCGAGRRRPAATGRSGAGTRRRGSARTGGATRAGGACPVEAPEQPGQRGRAVAGVQPHRGRRRTVRSRTRGCPCQPGGRPGTRRPASASAVSTTRRRPSAASEPAGCPRRDDLAVVDDHDPVAERVGLVQVVRGQEDRRALVPQAADVVPEAGPVLRVEPGGRLVQEEELGSWTTPRATSRRRRWPPE